MSKHVVGKTIIKPVSNDKIDIASGSSWSKSLSGVAVVIGAVLIALTLHDPSATTTSILSIQDITSSSSAAVHVLNILRPYTVDVVLPESTVKVVLKHEQPAVMVQKTPVQVVSEPEPVEDVVVIEEVVEEEVVVAPEPVQDQNDVDIIDWMVRGGAVFPNIEIREYANEYRGIHATADLSPADVLAKIPDQFIITFDKFVAFP
jgi:hypothetical protein